MIHILTKYLGLFGLTLAVIFAGQVMANEAEFDELSLEELSSMGLSNSPKNVTATTAAKVTQTLASAPSVVRIVTAEDIRTYGYQTLDDILRSLPGLYTTNDGLNTYLGGRGLGRPGDYNTRILILIDGVRVNDNIYDSALIGREFPLDVGLIERLEYAPGPGSAIYGKNAFFGVVNVITKSGNWYDGAELSGGVGTSDTGKARFTYGKRSDSGVEVLFSLSGFRNANVAPALSEEQAQYDSDADKNQTFLGKFSYGDFHAEVVYGLRESDVLVFPDSGLVDEYDEIRDEKLFVDARYSNNFGDNWFVEISGAYNQASYESSMPYIYEGERIEDVESSPGKWLTGELRVVNTSLKKHRLLFGVEGHKDLQLKSESYEKGYEPYSYMEDDYESYGFYLQDEISLSTDFSLLLGGRYDFTEFGDRFNPRVGLIWQPREESSIKLLYGSAFRTANFFEIGVNLDAREETQNPEYDVPAFETIQTYEVAIEHYFTSSTKFTGSLYYYQLDDIIEEQFDDDGFFVQNGQPVDATGVELAAEKRFAGGAIIDLSYTLQKTESFDGAELSNSPTHQFKARSSLPLWFERSRLGVEVQYTSERLTEEGAELAGYWLANATFTYQLNRFIDFSASVYNIGDTHYYDVARALLNSPEGIEHGGRSFYFQIDVKF